MSGLDHILAMVGIGVLSVQFETRTARLALPLVFLAAMVAGAFAAAGGVTLSFAEAGIALSVVAIGLVLALDVRLPLALTSLALAGFGLFHGFAHGAVVQAETSSSAAGFIAGMAIATAALMSLGAAAGYGIRYSSVLAGSRALRIAGGFAAAAGAVMLAQV